MSLRPEERESLCRKILNHKRIQGCIVVLCEGSIGYIDIHTPQQIREFENLPDANFWRATVPGWWRNKRPVFIPCGDRASVLSVYRELKTAHNSDPDNSYLSPEKLFALVDLDLQPADLSEISSHHSDTESLYHRMYHNSRVNKDVISESHILVTGWIHKEAYFLEPDLQALFDTGDYRLSFSGSQLQLDDVYRKMAHDLPQDNDIRKNFSRVWERVKNRINGHAENPEQLAKLWEKLFSDTTDVSAKRNLIESLLSIKKAKSYWKKISVSHAYPYSDEDGLRDSLMLEIASFYADRCEERWESGSPFYHIPQWIQLLRDYHQSGFRLS